MSYSEDDLVLISALQHFVFCERQCALIHIEQVWTENRLTAEGRLLHERVHEQDSESRAGVRIERGLPLRSLRLGLVGIADVVEFHPLPEGGWRPFPVEYKRGKPKPDRSDDVQLCAQAMCLEGMLEVSVASGAMFYGKIRRRHDVVFDEDIRTETKRVAEGVHALLKEGITPKPVFQKKCGQCSLLSLCLPKTVEKKRSIERYLAGAITE
ncbi:MAG: CRISPR-associated protein Cas4 [Desulfobacterales bacterium]|nr:CRISPR-associated protein Cas4 [Desulfobacterales bacterium]